MAAPALPPAPVLPEPDTTCPDCEDGAVLVGAGTAWEQVRRCRTCGGTGTLEISRCETCGTVVSDHEIDEWGVCDSCVRAGEEALDRETLEYQGGVLHPEVAWALEATKWLSTGEGAT